MSQSVSDNALEEMKAYYRTRANEYDEWFYRQGRYDRGTELNAQWFRQEQVATRTLNDGRQFSIIKNFYDPIFLEKQFAAFDLAITVKETLTNFIYGYGTRKGLS